MSKNEAIENENLENVSYETNSKNFIKENKEMENITKELKEIKEKLDSFELSEAEQESIIKDEIKKEKSDSKENKGGYIAFLAVAGLIIYLLWEKIYAKIKQGQATQITNI